LVGQARIGDPATSCAHKRDPTSGAHVICIKPETGGAHMMAKR
jgi:hypothetical protein